MRTRVLWALMIIAVCSSAIAAEQNVRIAVDVTKPGPTINRHIFGQFAEHLGRGIYEGVWVGPDSPIPNTRGIRNDVVAALKALRVPNVRWPGGCFADEYHWRKGIGPREKRPATLNPNWGGVIEPNTFGTHEFMDFMQQLGAEAYISINVGSGTPQEAAEWMEYMTAAQATALAQERAANGSPQPFKVPHLGIGNENWGCGGSMTAEHYLSQLKIFSRYARNYDSSQRMQKIAVGPDRDDTSYTETIMKAWKEKVWSWDIDGLSLHSYTTNGWPPAYKATDFGHKEYAALIKETLRMEDLIRTHSAIMDKYDPEKKLSLVVDEWGAWLVPTAGSNPGFLEQQNSQRDAIIAALNLNTFARHADRVRMANIAQMINVLQAMILTDKEKMLLTPTYHVFHMYVPFQDAAFIPVSFDAGVYQDGEISLPRIDAMAAKDSQGKVWIALTNVDPTRPVDIELAIAGARLLRASGETLAATKVDAVNTFAAPATVAPKRVSVKAANDKLAVKLAPHSVTVLGLE
jgi:alpha-L-arabinofuranosidase